MIEQFYEQNVVNNNIEARTKRTKTLTIAKTACIIIALFVLMTSMMFINDDSFLFWLGILAAVSVPFGAAAFILGHINKRNNVEYDYTLDDEYLKISEIYFRESRKLKYNIRLRTIESVGVFDSEGFKKNEGKAEKKQLALVNYDNEQAIVYILYNTEKGRRMIFIEPDRGFMIALRRVVSAITVFDKSIADFEKYIKQSEEAEEDISEEPETTDEEVSE